MFSWQRECTISTRSHARNNDYCSSKLLSNRRDVANFLEMFNTRCTISNSKKRFSPNIPEMLSSMDSKNCVFITLADQIEQWCQSPAFTLTPQTVSALTTTLSAHAMLIEDLLTEAYQYVITATLQSDPDEDVFPSTGE